MDKLDFYVCVFDLGSQVNDTSLTWVSEAGFEALSDLDDKRTDDLQH